MLDIVRYWLILLILTISDQPIWVQSYACHVIFRCYLLHYSLQIYLYQSLSGFAKPEKKLVHIATSMYMVQIQIAIDRNRELEMENFFFFWVEKIEKV